MENREAAAGILVCSSGVPALEGHRMRMYSANRILVRSDKEQGDPLALEVACQLARSLAARPRGNEELGLSSQLLVEKIERLHEIVEQAHDINGGSLEANRGLRRVDAAYTAMRRDALAVIYELQGRLAE